MSSPHAAALADADLCVKCGLCLPHCPTYRLTQHEADGPRGRIALTQGLLNGALQPSSALNAHLDGCLSCRACEAVCPAKVPYGRVLDSARAVLATPQRTRLTRLLAVVLDSPVLRALARSALWLLSARRDQPHAPMRGPGWWQARPVVRRWRAVRSDSPAPAAGQKAIGLFTGCVSDITERAVLQDAATLLRAAGRVVVIPADQGCCGALQQHGGLPAAAAARAERNARAFAGCDQVLSLATGCGAGLRDLGGKALAGKTADLCAALAQALDAQPLTFAPTTRRVGIHTACTQAHVFGATQAVWQLLQRIPGITLVDLAPASGCCGAAGTAFISQPTQAAQLLAPKLAAAQGVDVVVSANIGCSLHLLAGLRREGRGVEVLHPVSLLAQALVTPA